MRLTEAQILVLSIARDKTWIIRGREEFTAGVPNMPHTIGLREAFDSLVEQNLLVPVTEYRITEAGRLAHTSGREP
jgi:hypothetical protein